MKKVIIRVIVSIILFSTTLFAQNEKIVPKYWKEGRPYWDMPVDQDLRALSKTKKTLEYQFNPFHQSNETHGKETCHGGEVMIIQKLDKAM